MSLENCFIDFVVIHSKINTIRKFHISKPTSQIITKKLYLSHYELIIIVIIIIFLIAVSEI